MDGANSKPELAYSPGSRRSDRGGGFMLLFFVVVPTVIVVNRLAPSMLGPGIAAGVVLLWLYRRGLARPHRILRVEDGHLRVLSGGRRLLFEAPLESLSAVKLRTASIRGRGGLEAHYTRGGSMTNDDHLNASYIELVFEGGDEVPLSDTCTSNLDAAHWISQIRGHLRQHGWASD